MVTARKGIDLQIRFHFHSFDHHCVKILPLVSRSPPQNYFPSAFRSVEGRAAEVDWKIMCQGCKVRSSSHVITCFTKGSSLAGFITIYPPLRNSSMGGYRLAGFNFGEALAMKCTPGFRTGCKAGLYMGGDEKLQARTKSVICMSNLQCLEYASLAILAVKSLAL